jgi:hypothetical protein
MAGNGIGNGILRNESLALVCPQYLTPPMRESLVLAEKLEYVPLFAAITNPYFGKLAVPWYFATNPIRYRLPGK